jgi:hypothetical protein
MGAIWISDFGFGIWNLILGFVIWSNTPTKNLGVFETKNEAQSTRYKAHFALAQRFGRMPTDLNLVGR